MFKNLPPTSEIKIIDWLQIKCISLAIMITILQTFDIQVKKEQFCLIKRPPIESRGSSIAFNPKHTNLLATVNIPGLGDKIDPNPFSGY